MTYCYNDAKGYLTYGPTISGQAEFRRAVDKLPITEFPKLRQFVNDGICEAPSALASECRRFYRKLQRGPIKHTVGRLARAAEEAAQWIALTQ